LDLKEVFKKFAYFFISKKYKNLRMMIFSVIIVSLITIIFTFGLIYKQRELFESNKILEIENLKVYSNNAYQKNNTLVSQSIIYLKTTKPVRLELILDNVREKELREINTEEYLIENKINVTFYKGEILRPFILTGKMIDKQGNEMRIPDYDFIPGHTQMQITIS